MVGWISRVSGLGYGDICHSSLLGPGVDVMRCRRRCHKRALDFGFLGVFKIPRN